MISDHLCKENVTHAILEKREPQITISFFDRFLRNMTNNLVRVKPKICQIHKRKINYKAMVVKVAW